VKMLPSTLLYLNFFPRKLGLFLKSDCIKITKTELPSNFLKVLCNMIYNKFWLRNFSHLNAWSNQVTKAHVM
jgi:hypothetical protein